MDLKPDPNSWPERTKQGHRLEYHFEWEYHHRWTFERDHPNGWADRETPPAGDGWEPNTEIGDECTPGLRAIDGASGRMLIAHWRRRRSGGQWQPPAPTTSSYAP